MYFYVQEEENVREADKRHISKKGRLIVSTKSRIQDRTDFTVILSLLSRVGRIRMDEAVTLLLADEKIQIDYILENINDVNVTNLGTNSVQGHMKEDDIKVSKVLFHSNVPLSMRGGISSFGKYYT